jgi:hypothetical protein
MVYCAKCGAKNEDGVAHCVSCGANLNIIRRGSSENNIYMFFGKSINFNDQNMWIIYGLMTLVAGSFGFIAITFFSDSELSIYLRIWPGIVIVIGALMVISPILNKLAISKLNS